MRDFIKEQDYVRCLTDIEKEALVRDMQQDPSFSDALAYAVRKMVVPTGNGYSVTVERDDYEDGQRGVFLDAEKDGNALPYACEGSIAYIAGYTGSGDSDKEHRPGVFTIRTHSNRMTPFGDDLDDEVLMDYVNGSYKHTIGDRIVNEGYPPKYMRMPE